MMNPQPPPVHIIRGMKVGCMPYDAMIESTLECFYSAECLNGTSRWISHLPDTAWPKPLDRYILERFLPNDSIRDIIDKQMVNKWNIKRNFTAYFSGCSPIECKYSFSRQSSFIYLISLLISLYGSLTVGLHLIAPWIAKSIQFIKMHVFRGREKNETRVQQGQGKTKQLSVYTDLSCDENEWLLKNEIIVKSCMLQMILYFRAGFSK
jgi:hypothetical protein